MFITLLALLACFGGKSDADAKNAAIEPIAVKAVTVEAAPMPRTLALAGTLVAIHQVQLAADANGVVISTQVERGQRVKKGEVLITVDTRVANLSAAAGAAQARAQEAQLTAAVAECERAEKLKAEGVISQAQYERARAACDAQKAALDAARASASLASTQATKTFIRAPFDGIVGERLVEVGSFVAAQSPVVTLYADGLPRVRFTVGEANAAKVSPGAEVRVRLSGGSDEWFTGSVKTVSGAVREMTRDVVVEAELEPLSGPALPGMSAQVELVIDKPITPVVPTSALRSVGPVRRVFLVKDNAAFEVVVRVGAEEGANTAILEGVVAGDQVVAEPPAALRDGSPLALSSVGD